MSSDSITKWGKWVDHERNKHRVMTAAEYSEWCEAGDAISHPATGNAFPGGITITFGPDGRRR